MPRPQNRPGKPDAKARKSHPGTKTVMPTTGRLAILVWPYFPQCPSKACTLTQREIKTYQPPRNLTSTNWGLQDQSMKQQCFRLHPNRVVTAFSTIYCIMQTPNADASPPELAQKYRHTACRHDALSCLGHVNPDPARHPCHNDPVRSQPPTPLRAWRHRRTSGAMRPCA